MRNKILDKFAINFIKNHFDEIDLKRCSWDVKIKRQAIKEIKEKDFMAGWIITEVMAWGTKTNYIKPYEVENNDDLYLIKIGKKYFALDYDNSHCFKEVVAKKVVVNKFVFKEEIA